MNRSSLRPTSRSMSFISSGCSSKCRITSSFASMSWSMYSPSWSVSPRTMTGSRCWILACTADLITGGRSCHSCGCSRSMIRSTTPRISARAVAAMWSAILSGSNSR